MITGTAVVIIAGRRGFLYDIRREQRIGLVETGIAGPRRLGQ
jgi:hypothetical protein